MMAKRLFDVVAVVASAVFVVPLVGIIALAVALKLGTPVLFRQPRVGLDGRIFGLVKFRTMTQETDAAGNLLPDAERLPPFGRWLRSTSLDELPTLWCVLRGDMSLVGPRPLLTEYLHLYSAEQARRHEVRPGVTGWAQVNGRNAVDWSTRLAHDVWYVDHRSFTLDMQILWRTVTAVLTKRGISHGTEATMPKFTGSPGNDR